MEAARSAGLIMLDAVARLYRGAARDPRSFLRPYFALSSSLSISLSRCLRLRLTALPSFVRAFVSVHLRVLRVLFFCISSISYWYFLWIVNEKTLIS